MNLGGILLERKLRRCACCGTEYSFCPKCSEDKDKPLFYFTFCSENCKEIYNVTSQFENGQITSGEAQNQLKKLNLSRLDYLGTSYKNSINKIMNTVPVVSLEEDIIKTMDNTVEIEEVLETSHEEIEENISIKKPKNKRAKNVE